jgi:hypothetical protein
MFSPFGPVRRQNISRYQTPWHDIVPKPSKLGDNWIGFGHSDSFVKVENSGLGIYPQLPPPPCSNGMCWRRLYTRALSSIQQHPDILILSLNISKQIFFPESIEYIDMIRG